MGIADLDKRIRPSTRPCVECRDTKGDKRGGRTPTRSLEGRCWKCYSKHEQSAWRGHIKAWYEPPPPLVPQRPTYIMDATDEEVVLPMPNPPPKRTCT